VAVSDILYLGCYTEGGGGRGTGVVAVRRDTASGEIEAIGTMAATPSPSFLARHPTLPVLYAANELDDGAINAWAAQRDGSLRSLATRSTGGASPCHLSVTADGQYLVTANYGGGSVAVHPLESTGAPGERSDLVAHHGRGADPQRQERPHAHMVSPGPGGQPILAVDLGTDSIYRYDVEDATGRLVPRGERVAARPGSGPRHLARHPDGRRCYVVGELDATVTTYDLDATGELYLRGRLGTSTRTGHVQPSEVAVRADGRFLYISNRGVDTIAVFSLDDQLPRYVAEVDTQGEWPRHFALIGEHLYVANERSHTVAVFNVDPTSGVPVPSGQLLEVASPTCVLSMESSA